jgi:hypothetical protein
MDKDRVGGKRLWRAILPGYFDEGIRPNSRLQIVLLVASVHSVRFSNASILTVIKYAFSSITCAKVRPRKELRRDMQE